MTDSLVSFLRDRWDEEERDARAADFAVWTLDPGWDGGVYLWADDPSGWIAPGEESGPHIARWDPSRVLADLAVKRALLDQIQGAYGGYADALWDMAYRFAEVYRDHPAYDPVWAATAPS